MNNQYNPKHVLQFFIVLFVYIINMIAFIYILFFDTRYPNIFFLITSFGIPASTFALSITLKRIKYIVFSNTSIDYYIGNMKYRSLRYNVINSLYISAAVGNYYNTILKNDIPVPFISAFSKNNIEPLLANRGYISIFRKKWCRYLFAIEIANVNSLDALLRNTSIDIYITSGILMTNADIFRDFTKEYAQRIVVIK